MEQSKQNLTVRQLWEFANKYNMPDAPLVFLDGCFYNVCTANLDVNSMYPEHSKIILKDE